ncbi:MAG TPA: orotidine-5'-phosphate decarboxylase, partial [Candidatus Saccharimonadales bacterium]|nr:orotidine-5'-phosphate decarboxylase [Candidatus Saccharimonadales bacterium]
AYKPNSAFYEAHGSEGIMQLRETCHFLREQYPEIPIVLDFKRADIGNTNSYYTDFAFNRLGVDAVTIHPYLGREAVQPFLDHADKGVIVLCRTSNDGAAEFQDLEVDGKKLYLRVAENVKNNWNTNGNCLLVTGATYPEELAEIRATIGNEMWLLVPGIGAQGGDVAATVKAGGEHQIIASSRAIIYASNGDNFAKAAATEARKTRDEINKYRS